jgi:predicted amidohydrolase YtcJ
MNSAPDIVILGAKVTTLDRANPQGEAVAIRDGKIAAVGSTRDIASMAGPKTQTIDAGGRRVIPGLNDSHTHLIRGGLNYNMELRWDGVPSLADALRMLKEQAQRTPAPQWVRVVGGWSEFQFAERRMPTLEEINAAAPDTPVFVLHLYDRAILNRAALRAVGYSKETPNPPGAEIQRDSSGEPTGLLIARPNALILYATLAKGPKLPFEDQVNSTRHFMRELNRLGVTSVIDAGGGFQNYPDDYKVVEQLHHEGLLTVRIAYNLFPQKPKEEIADFTRWTGMLKPRQGDDMYRHNGGGEMLVFSAADFEDFLEPRPELAGKMEGELERVVRLLAENRWPFRMHATYDETITRALNVVEKVNKDVPFDGIRFIIDHAETITPKNIERVKALGGGIAIQHRMAFQGEYFVDRYGERAAEATPPIARMLDMDVPVGAGTDATRVASYNPWVALYWLTAGKTVGGLRITSERNTLDRATALNLWTKGSAWFSGEEGLKGALCVGEYADLAVLSDDYFSVASEEIKNITSLLTIVGGRIVHGSGDYSKLAPALPPPSPDWSPVRTYGGYQHANPSEAIHQHARACADGCGHACDVHGHSHQLAWTGAAPAADLKTFWGAFGCSCFAF